jgi:speckle-type POZ protein
MSTERKIVFESFVPQCRLNFQWKIRNISLFLCSPYQLQSGRLSINENEYLQLAMVRCTVGDTERYSWIVTLMSSTVNYTNVDGELSIVIKEKKYLTRRNRLQLHKKQNIELWNIERQSVLDLLKEHGIKDDALTLDINIETWQEDTTEMINCLIDKAPINLNIQMTKMLTDQTLTDVTLKVKDKEFKAHKVVLAAASPVFEAMFKEGTREHESNFVKIEDIDSDVFKVFLRYLYSGQVHQLDEMVSDLLAAADKYDVQPLREICIQHMAKNISADNAVDMLALAHRHSIDSIKSVASEYLRKNFVDVTRTDSWTSLFDNYVAKK